ncbi:hypothetical protein BgiBS90_009450 [Biomphalaria glabrata]|nr:hypothetical protein BgiBS90_009450 [Biomphalaria glabrata]
MMAIFRGYEDTMNVPVLVFYKVHCRRLCRLFQRYHTSESESLSTFWLLQERLPSQTNEDVFHSQERPFHCFSDTFLTRQPTQSTYTAFHLAVLSTGHDPLVTLSGVLAQDVIFLLSLRRKSTLSILAHLNS